MRTSRATFLVLVADDLLLPLRVWRTAAGFDSQYLGDVWRSADGVAWNATDAAAVFGPREAHGAVVLGPSILLVGGMRRGPRYIADAWTSTNQCARRARASAVGVPFVTPRGGALRVCTYVAPVACEVDGEVCGTHGLCTSAATCDCSVWWRGPACGTAYCNASICVHGTCVDDGAGDGGQVCECAAGWAGPGCGAAICASGCDAVHGYCAAPGECSCVAGWGGPLCTTAVGSGALHDLGAWFNDNRTPSFIALGSVGLCWVWTHAWVANVLRRRPGLHMTADAEKRRKAGGGSSKHVRFAAVLVDVAPPAEYFDESSDGEMSGPGGGGGGGGGAGAARFADARTRHLTPPVLRGTPVPPATLVAAAAAAVHERSPSPPPPRSGSPIAEADATSV